MEKFLSVIIDCCWHKLCLEQYGKYWLEVPCAITLNKQVTHILLDYPFLLEKDISRTKQSLSYFESENKVKMFVPVFIT